jgi:peptide/nickel transport system permease protein
MSGDRATLAKAGAIMAASLVLVAVLSPWLVPYDAVLPATDSFGEPLPPCWAHPCGTDELGRDVCTRLLLGARLSLFIAVVATGLAVGIGVLVGVSAGHFGGWVDSVLMRVTDSVIAFPVLLLAIALAALFEPGLWTLLLVIALVGWTGIARTVRGEVLSLRQRDYVVAAHAMGASSARIIWHHLLPGIRATVVVVAALGSGSTILLDAGLSFLGLGIPPPAPSWGRMLSESQTYYRVAPWLMLFPGAAIVYAVAAFNLLGYGLAAHFATRQR